MIIVQERSTNCFREMEYFYEFLGFHSRNRSFEGIKPGTPPKYAHVIVIIERQCVSVSNYTSRTC